jgi:hypothetical protein
MNQITNESIQEVVGLPKFWGVKIIYWDKSEENFNEVAHSVLNGMYNYTTAEDVYEAIPIDKIKKITYDKQFSLYLAMKTKESEAKQGV